MFLSFLNDKHSRSRNIRTTPAKRSLQRTPSKCVEMGCEQSKSHVSKEGFQVSVDVQHFQPNEISVKTVDNSVVIEAKHEEKQDDYGFISRQFTRRYTLPEGFKAEGVVSSLSSDGILTVEAAPAKAIEGNTRQVQIQQTGPVRGNVKKVELAKRVEAAKKRRAHKYYP